MDQQDEVKPIKRRDIRVGDVISCPTSNIESSRHPSKIVKVDDVDAFREDGMCHHIRNESADEQRPLMIHITRRKRGIIGRFIDRIIGLILWRK